jgi:hypothetical protein
LPYLFPQPTPKKGGELGRSPPAVFSDADSFLGAV